MIHLTIQNFDAEVLHSDVPVLVLWSAVVNVASSQIAIQMSKLDPAKVKIASVDIDQNPELVMRFSISDLPFVVLFVGGLAMASDTKLSSELLRQVN